MATAAIFVSACSNEAEDAVRRHMLDPAAAQFREVSRCSADPSVWGGEVNGKNAYGAYTGFKSFYYADYQVVYAGDEAFSKLMYRCFGTTEEESMAENPNDDPVVANAKRALRDLKKAEARYAESLSDAAAEAEGQAKTYPYVAPDGVDIFNAEDERNWQKYGTTTPGGE